MSDLDVRDLVGAVVGGGILGMCLGYVLTRLTIHLTTPPEPKWVGDCGLCLAPMYSNQPTVIFCDGLVHDDCREHELNGRDHLRGYHGEV